MEEKLMEDKKNIETDNLKEEKKHVNIDERTEDIEGFSYCSSSKQKCMTDCSGNPVISTLS